MNWSEIATQLIIGIGSVLISAVGVLLTYFINKYIKNDKLKTILKELNELVQNSVLEVYQTYVEALKKGDCFNEECQKKALTMALELINKNMSADLQKYLNDNISNVTDYLKDLIEAQIGLLKNKAK